MKLSNIKYRGHELQLFWRNSSFHFLSFHKEQDNTLICVVAHYTLICVVAHYPNYYFRNYMKQHSLSKSSYLMLNTILYLGVGLLQHYTGEWLILKVDLVLNERNSEVNK